MGLPALWNRLPWLAPLALASAGIASAAAPPDGNPAARVLQAQPCPVGARGAIFETACEVAHGLGGLEGPILVVAGAPTADGPATKPGDLATRVAESVAAAVGTNLAPPRGALSLGEARAR